VLIYLKHYGTKLHVSVGSRICNKAISNAEAIWHRTDSKDPELKALSSLLIFSLFYASISIPELIQGVSRL
jgi:hypothetical protein